MVVSGPPCCTSLNSLEFVYIGLGIGVKDRASIFKLGTDQGLIGTLSYIRGLYLYVPLDKAKRTVSIGSNLVYVVVPGQIVGDVYTKIASILSCLYGLFMEYISCGFRSFRPSYMYNFTL